MVLRCNRFSESFSVFCPDCGNTLKDDSNEHLYKKGCEVCSTNIKFGLHDFSRHDDGYTSVYFYGLPCLWEIGVGIKAKVIFKDYNESEQCSVVLYKGKEQKVKIEELYSLQYKEFQKRRESVCTSG